MKCRSVLVAAYATVLVHKVAVEVAFGIFQFI